MNGSVSGSGFMDLEVPMEVWLAAEEVPLERLLGLEPGGVLPLTRNPDGPVDLVVNGSVVASGELVVVEGRLGLRVTSIALQKIGGAEAGPAPAPHAPKERA